MLLYHIDYNEILKDLIIGPLKDITIPLILTDPPYNVNAKAKAQAKKSKEKKVSYDDNQDKIKYFADDFFNLSKNAIRKDLCSSSISS